MTKLRIGLQDLRRRMYVKGKAEKPWRLIAGALVGRGGVGLGFMGGCGCSRTIALPMAGPKALPANRSHNPGCEVTRKAQCRKPARWV